jgi:hypothetical protein
VVPTVVTAVMPFVLLVVFVFLQIDAPVAFMVIAAVAIHINVYPRGSGQVAVNLDVYAGRWWWKGESRWHGRHWWAGLRRHDVERGNGCCQNHDGE